MSPRHPRARRTSPERHDGGRQVNDRPADRPGTRRALPMAADVARRLRAPRRDPGSRRWLGLVDAGPARAARGRGAARGMGPGDPRRPLRDPERPCCTGSAATCPSGPRRSRTACCCSWSRRASLKITLERRWREFRTRADLAIVVVGCSSWSSAGLLGTSGPVLIGAGAVRVLPRARSSSTRYGR